MRGEGNKMNWKLSAEQNCWQYCDERGKIVATLRWDNPNQVYRDGEGNSLGREFNAARKLIETGNVPQSQGRLAL